MTDEKEFSFYWNYRIVNAKSENGGEDWYCLKEVVYHDGKPSGYSDPSIGSEDMDSMRDVWRLMSLAMEVPPLQESDFEGAN
jgi:hypothetical protein